MRQVALATSKDNKIVIDRLIKNMLINGFEITAYSTSETSLNAILSYELKEGKDAVRVSDITEYIQAGGLISFH